VLVILFSVVFPTLKMLALGASLFRPALLRTNRLVKLLAFDLSKWSMADVMALAIFMSFVAFNGVIGSAWDGVRSMPNIQAGVDPDECFQDPARLLLVHWFLPVEHLPVEEAGAWNSFPLRPQINLASLLAPQARCGTKEAGISACSDYAPAFGMAKIAGSIVLFSSIFFTVMLSWN
jgi:hypothetical protein